MLLDTDVLIDIFRKLPVAVVWLAGLPEPPSVVGFAAMEALYGCRDAKDLRNVQATLRGFEVLWPTKAGLVRAMEEYIPLCLAHGIGVLDTLVAATATEYDMPLATLNVKHFRAVPELKIVPPYEK